MVEICDFFLKKGRNMWFFCDNCDLKSSKDLFKKRLDTFLANVPDQPNVGSSYSSRIGATTQNGKKTNSLTDVLKFYKL